jgi:SAM-dependent methyltransferase
VARERLGAQVALQRAQVGEQPLLRVGQAHGADEIIRRVGDDELAGALRGIRDLYAASLAAHGPGPAAVGWRDAAAQQLRFARLARVLDDHPVDGPAEVADWGCGYGALLAHLDARGAPLARYDGYDLSADMLAVAPADPRCRWIQSSALDRDYDYVFVSGTLNVRLGAPEAVWAEHVRATLRALHARARRGLAFNLMTSWVDWRSDDLFYADPAEWFTFCRRELSRAVSLQHDYPLHEWTMIVGAA